MRKVPHGYRTGLGGGFPDLILIDGIKHFFIELKVLKIGPSGDIMLRGQYQPTQMPWHLKYFLSGGKSLYTVFKLENKYGVIHETPEYVRAVLNGLKYKEMLDGPWRYKEFKVLGNLIDDIRQ